MTFWNIIGRKKSVPVRKKVINIGMNIRRALGFSIVIQVPDDDRAMVLKF